MSSDLRLDAALKLLKATGHQIDDATALPPFRGEAMLEVTGGEGAREYPERLRKTIGLDVIRINR